MLSALMKKGWLASHMTATPATDATDELPELVNVAGVATVAVINSQASQITGMGRQAVMRWLHMIGEADPEIIQSVLERCASDAAALAYVFRELEAEAGTTVKPKDDRRYCRMCQNLSPQGFCLAACRGELPAGRSYQPIDDIPRRCIGYLAMPDEADQRPGRHRWPYLNKQECNQ